MGLRGGTLLRSFLERPDAFGKLPEFITQKLVLLGQRISLPFQGLRANKQKYGRAQDEEKGTNGEEGQGGVHSILELHQYVAIGGILTEFATAPFFILVAHIAY